MACDMGTIFQTLPAVFGPSPGSRGKCEHLSTASAFPGDPLVRSLHPAFLAEIRPVLNTLREEKCLPALPAGYCYHAVLRIPGKQIFNPFKHIVSSLLCCSNSSHQPSQIIAHIRTAQHLISEYHSGKSSFGLRIPYLILL